MGGGVTTTGSLLNQRVFKRDGGSGSSNKGGGVQRHELLNTKITLADRNKGTGKATYTGLSNSINGRKEVIYVGGGSKYSGKAGMTTADKIAMWNNLAQSGFSFIKGVGDSVGSFKTDKAGGSNPKQTVSGNNPEVLVNNNTKVAGNDLASTLETLGFNDIDLTNIDYTETAKDLTSKMDKAKNSQDLYQALQGAKAYKQQMDSRMSGINIKDLNDKLTQLEGDAKGSIKDAKGKVDTADKGVKDAESNVKQGQRQVDSARESYDAARGSIKTDNKAYNDASKLVDTKTKEYDQAGKALDTAKKKYSTAQAATRECTQAWETAKTNTAQALSNLNALKSQQGFGTDGAALQAQIADAQAKYDAAVAAEGKAEEAKTNAEKAEAQAKDALGDDSKGAVQAFNNAKSGLAEARDGLKQAAEQLKNSKEITQEQYDLLTNRQESARKAEDNLATQNDNLSKAKVEQEKAQSVLDGLNAKKEELEVQIHDYKEMQQASEKLGDLSKYETKLENMMKKEGTDREELTKKLNEKDNTSNDTKDVNAKGRRKAEKKEAKITDKLAELNAGDATDDIARDKNIQISNRLDQMAKMNDFAGTQDFGSFGSSNKTTINGHTVEYKQGKYFVDGSTTGMDRMGAEMLIKTQAFTVPKKPTFS